MGPTEDPVLCSLGELEARDNLPRVPHAAVEAFQYSTPCIITGATRSWKVPVAEGPGEGTGWSPEGLVARHGAQDFEVSLPGNGAARWTMARYLDYCRGWEEGLERGCEDGGGTGAALEGGRETDIADPDGTTQQGKAERSAPPHTACLPGTLEHACRHTRRCLPPHPLELSPDRAGAGAGADQRTCGRRWSRRDPRTKR